MEGTTKGISQFGENQEPQPTTKLSWAIPGSVDSNKHPILEALSPYFSRLQKGLPPSPPSFLGNQKIKDEIVSHPRTVLEISSGFGDHIIHYATRFRPSENKIVEGIVFLPTEVDDYLRIQISRNLERARKSSNFETEDQGPSTGLLQNILEPMVLNVENGEDWKRVLNDEKCGRGRSFDLITINSLVHVAPWRITESLFRHLSPLTSSEHPTPILNPETGALIMYGPFLHPDWDPESAHHQGDEMVPQPPKFASPSDAEFDAKIRARSEEFGLRSLIGINREARKWGMEESKEERKAMPKGNWIVVYRSSSTLLGLTAA